MTRMTVHEQLALDSALASLRVSLNFVSHALNQLPDDKALRLSVVDARDVLAVAVDAVETRVTK